MFMEVGAPQQRPHFHAVYEDGKAVFGLDPIVGGGQGRQTRHPDRLANLAMEPTARI
jgi:hypothetical protein